jgi:hypothetical protein
MDTVQAPQPMPAPNPASRAEVLSAFNSEAWLIELAGYQGINLKEIPDSVRQEILACKTKNWVNIKFFDWLRSKPSEHVEFTAEDTTLFEQMVSLRKSPAYEREKSQLASKLSQAKNYFDAAQSELISAGEIRAKLMQLEGTPSISLTEEIKKCIADGWYKYDPTLTKEWNRANTQGIVFTTATVTTKYYNKKAGIEMDVNLGRFKVVYQPARNSIKVLPFEDNVHSSGHIHPHIGSGGSVCWGNAEDTYVHCMDHCQPSKAFLALRVILTTYNSDSPYVDLHEFAVQRNPELLEGKEKVWVQTCSAWYQFDEIPENVTGVRESGTDDDGNDITYVRLWHQTYEGTNIPCEMDGDDRPVYFFRCTTGESDNPYTYVEIDKDYISGDW